MKPEEIYKACTDALEQYVKSAGFDDVVIGLSGGMDSALVAVMAVDAFGPEHVHGVLLPGPYSSEHSIDDAQKLAGNLGIETQTLSIVKPYNAFADLLDSSEYGALTGIAAENTQARCRMVCIMALSNGHNWLMLNTGNKSEAMMGYSTLYGDTAGAFAPLGGIYKSDVYSVARWRNDQAHEQGQDLIPENIFEKPPSAELPPGQVDEDSQGMDYASLDRILKGVFEYGMSVDELVEDEGMRREVAEIVRRANSFAFKRALEPPYPQADFYA
ncbi:MAG: NAD(+) synthase [Eggerthellaceae bacterium]|nr:NAD(+) synthase [Eggerthellaceae bacterium]